MRDWRRRLHCWDPKPEGSEAAAMALAEEAIMGAAGEADGGEDATA